LPEIEAISDSPACVTQSGRDSEDAGYELIKILRYQAPYFNARPYRTVRSGGDRISDSPACVTQSGRDSEDAGYELIKILRYQAPYFNG
jgi:hypothetical protein